VAEVRDY